MSSAIPENIKGKSVDIEHDVVEDSPGKAQLTFERVCAKLVNPAAWHSIAGELSAKFTLHHSENMTDTTIAEAGDYLAIDVPGPGPVAGEGFDWVTVELLQKNTEPYCDASIVMRLRASKNPFTKDTRIAHFFDSHATSTFIIKKMGNKVSAAYHGRNEMANTAETSLVDKLRNKIVAAGAEAGLSELQWEALVKGFLQPEKGK